MTFKSLVTGPHASRTFLAATLALASGCGANLAATSEKGGLERSGGREAGPAPQPSRPTAQRPVVIYGIGESSDAEDRESVADLSGRQLLLMAAGAEVRWESGKLGINSSGVIRGVTVSVEEDRDDYRIVKVTASVPEIDRAQFPADPKKTVTITKTTALRSVVQSITEAVGEFIGPVRPAQAQGATPAPGRGAIAMGRVVLTKMALVPGKSPPDCTYIIQVTRMAE